MLTVQICQVVYILGEQLLVFLPCLHLVSDVFAGLALVVNSLWVPLVEFVNHKCQLGNTEDGVQSDGLQLICQLVKVHRKLLNSVIIVLRRTRGLIWWQKLC